MKILPLVSEMVGTKKIITNLGIVYFKTACTFLIGLFTTRIILQALGASDFGLYSLMAGMVGLLSFLNGALSVGTQRFLSFQLGKGDALEARSIFAASVFFHCAAGIIIVLFIEVAGGYALEHLLNFDPARRGAAGFILHCMAISTFFSIIATPYDAVIYAHENFLIDALLGIPDSLARLFLAMYLQDSSLDRLKVYGVGLAILMVVQRIFRQVYCRRYDETQGRIFPLDKKILREMAGYSSWTLLGGLLYIGRYQGMPIVFNLFLGTLINAAYGIADQINGQIHGLSVTLMRTANPQLMKHQGAGDDQKAHSIAIMGCKYSFILFAIIAIPIFIKVDDILLLWVKNPPPETSFFCRAFIVLSLLRQLSGGIHSLVQANGRVKWFEITVNSILFLNIPIAYLILKTHHSIHSVFFIAILVNIVLWLIEVGFAHSLTGLSFRKYFYHTLGQASLPILVAIAVGLVARDLVESAALDVIFVTSTSACSFLAALYFTGLDTTEREIAQKLGMRILKPIQRILPVQR